MQGALLYAAELIWSGRECMEGEYQAAITRMGRATLGLSGSAQQSSDGQNGSGTGFHQSHHRNRREDRSTWTLATL